MQKGLAFLRRRCREIFAVGAVSLAGLLAAAYLAPKSLDYLFFLRGPVQRNDQAFAQNAAAIVFLKEGGIGDWTPYSKLLTTLTRVGARAVVFDTLFTDNAWNTHSSLPQFKSAVQIATSSNVLVVFASQVITLKTNNVSYRHVSELITALSDIVRSVPGNVTVGYVDLPEGDQVVRSYYGEKVGTKAPLALAVHWALGNVQTPDQIEPGDFLVNYYGPPATIEQCSVDAEHEQDMRQVLRLTNKIVFVGNNVSDQHKTPFATFRNGLSSGAEIHATAYENTVASSYIRDPLGRGAAFQLVLTGSVLGLLFVKRTPLCALAIAGGLAPLFIILSFIAFKWCYVFIPWLPIAAVQLPVACATSFIPVKSVFISHRSADNSTARDIMEGLERLGVETYLAFAEDQSGDLEPGLLEEVARRGNFLLVVSSNLVGFAEPPNVDWVGEEIAKALEQGKSILLANVDLSLKSLLDKCAASRPYEAQLTRIKESNQLIPQQVLLREVLNKHFQAPFLTGSKDLNAHLTEISAKLKWTIRKDWKKSRFLDHTNANQKVSHVARARIGASLD